MTGRRDRTPHLRPVCRLLAPLAFLLLLLVNLHVVQRLGPDRLGLADTHTLDTAAVRKAAISREEPVSTGSDSARQVRGVSPTGYAVLPGQAACVSGGELIEVDEGGNGGQIPLHEGVDLVAPGITGSTPPSVVSGL